MLGKRYSLGDTFEATGEPLVKIANFEELNNGTPDIREFLKGFKPDSNYMYLHVIAMGAGEYWGKNINSDYFPEHDLVNRHKTFETDASVFHEHDNKPYSKKYGKVAFAWYNPTMHRVELILAIDKVAGKEFVDRVERGERLAVSMGCFPAGTEIYMEDGTIKNIEDVLPGDKVITHTGEAHEVNTKMLHEYSGNMCKIKVAGQTEELTCTDNHPILVRKFINTIPQREGFCSICGKHIKFLGQHFSKNTKKISFPDKHKEYLEKVLFTDFKYKYIECWKEAKDLVPGDYIVDPFLRIDKNEITESTDKTQAFAKILGYFLSEGNYLKYLTRKNDKSSIKKGGLNFTFHEKESYLHDDVIRCLNILSNKKIIKKRTQNKTVLIQIYDTELVNKIFELTGEYSYNKFLSSKLFNLPDNEKLLLLGSYIDGDGTYIKKTNRLSVTSVSKQLIEGFAKFAGSIGINSSIITDIHNTKSGYRKAWRLMICVQDAPKLQDICFKAKSAIKTESEYKLTVPKVFISNNSLVKEVTSIETYHVDNLPVYNLSVEEDESYTANNIAVHNCRVKFDVCSICGNKASKPNEYCDHIKYHKGEIFPDGKQAYMINYNPTFFDKHICRA